jgi:hypothetical protein
MNMKNHNDMNSKQSYSAPEAELLEVKFEENFLTSPDPEDGNPNRPFGAPRRSTDDYHIGEGF